MPKILCSDVFLGEPEPKIDARSFAERFDELREALLALPCLPDERMSADRLLLALKADVDEYTKRLSADLVEAENRAAETEPTNRPIGEAFDEVVDLLGDPSAARDKLDRLKRRVLSMDRIASEALARAEKKRLLYGDRRR